MRHGFLLVHKPSGPTSHDIVAQVRRTLSETHIGHLGTLDPLAEGLLVLAVGKKALKVIELFEGLPKEYVAEITLGAESSTYDAEGVIVETKLMPSWKPPADLSALDVFLRRRFLGKIEQVPPIYSAVNVGGERAYRKARQGRTVVMPTREVVIDELAVLTYRYPVFTCRVRCSAGTYIRSLAHDIGAILHCGAYLSALTRTEVGTWTLKQACPPEQVSWTKVMPLKDVLALRPQWKLSDEEWNEIQFGRPIAGTCARNTVAWHDDLPCALLETHPTLPGMVKPRKVLAR